MTDEGGWVVIQAKKGLTLTAAAGGPLGKAVDQLIEIEDKGVPSGPPGYEQQRKLEPGRDLVLILTDHTGHETITNGLAPVVRRLRDLPEAVPVDEAARNEPEARALGLLRGHVGRAWRERHGWELTDPDFRRLTKVLSVHKMHLEDGGEQRISGLQILGELTEYPAQAHSIWTALEQEAQRLAEERSYLDRQALVRRLELQDINLRPVARLRSDIKRLRHLTNANLSTPPTPLTVTTPEGPIALPRTVAPVLRETDGNLAITGVPGAGKTVLLYALAETYASANSDLVLLQANNLRASAGATRNELNLIHDLSDVLLGWTGDIPGLLLIDGLDQAKAEHLSDWLPQLAQKLAGTRWRVVATIRIFDLKHDRRWQAMFRGDPIPVHAPDPELAAVRHIVIGDLSADELKPLRAGSPALTKLMDDAHPRLKQLLHNPFNLNLAGQLPSTADVELAAVDSRVDLLDLYWKSRVRKPPGELDRTRTLQAVVTQMLDTGHTSVNPLNLPLQATSDALEALRSDGVLRDLPVAAGAAVARVGFSHQVLFDYTAAILALGDQSDPDSLADVLDHKPNLVITVRPSLEYRLAIAWRDQPSRRLFWHMALQLSARSGGHILAAVVAAQIAARESNYFGDVDELAKACTGDLVDATGRWDKADAAPLAFLVAAAVSRRSSPALNAVAALCAHLAERARADDDVDVAMLAAQLPLRAVTQDTLLQVGDLHPQWVSVAVDCMMVALADLMDPNRGPLAKIGGRLLAAVAPRDPHTVAEVIRAVLTREAMAARSANVVSPLIAQLPELMKSAPDLAVDIGAAVWEYEEEQDTATSMGNSLILGLTSNRKQDLDAVRHQVAKVFPALLQIDLTASSQLFLRIIERPAMYPWSDAPTEGLPPNLRRGSPLESARRQLREVTDEFIQALQDAAEAREQDPQSARSQEADRIISKLVIELHHDEVWQRLVLHAVRADSLALGRALLPALVSPSLFEDTEAWVSAAQLAARLAPTLSPGDHQRVEDAVWGLVDAGLVESDAPSNRSLLERQQLQVLNALDHDKLSPRARELLAAHHLESLELFHPTFNSSHLNHDVEAGWVMPSPEPGTFDDLVFRIRTQLEASQSNDPQKRADGFHGLVDLWPELVEVAADASTEATATELSRLRLAMAARLAHASAVTPGSDLGVQVYGALLAERWNPVSSEEITKASWRFTDLTSWTQTNMTNAVDGLVGLLWRTGWREAHGDEISAALKPLMDSPSPVFRFLAYRALTMLHPDQDDLLEVLAQRLAIESDRHIVGSLLGKLARFIHSEPSRVDDIFSQLGTRSQWTAWTSSAVGDETLTSSGPETHGVSVLVLLAACHETPYASEVVSAWLGEPIENPQRARHAFSVLRNTLNPSEIESRPAQARAFKLFTDSLDQLRVAFTSEDSDRQARSVKLADELASQVCFASSTFDDENTGGEATPRGDAHVFASFALPVIDGLADIHHPSITHHLIDTLDHLASTQPKKVIQVAAKALAGDLAYAREQLGLTATLNLVKNFVATHYTLVLGDDECTSAIRALLEPFVRLGWDAAIELVEELDELFV